MDKSPTHVDSCLRARGIISEGRLQGTQVLIQRSLEILVSKLQEYGSELSEDHVKALHKIISTYTLIAEGHLKGRYCFDLGCGLGKTLSITSWIVAVSELNLNISASISASKIESLIDIKRQLISAGVSEDQIGLVHSYKYDESRAEQWLKTRDPSCLQENGKTTYASLPATKDHQSKQFLLYSHNKIKNGTGSANILLFNGKERNLIVWDESLLSSDSRSIPKRLIKQSLGWLAPLVDDYRQDTALQSCFSYLNECWDICSKESEAQEIEGKEPEAISFPERTSLEIEVYRDALKNHQDGDRLNYLLDLLDISQAKLRVLSSKQSSVGGLITYDISVPPELNNMVVLDASYGIRLLERFDTTIKQPEGSLSHIKSYESVSIYHLPYWSGRHSIEGSFKEDKRENRKVSNEIIPVIQKIPMDEAIILFTFKPKRGLDIRKKLEEDMLAAGIDIHANVEVKVTKKDENGNSITVTELKPRIIYVSWGSETSINDYSYARNVIFSGIIHRSPHDLASAIAGQKKNLLTDITSELIEEVSNSELCHCLYQAISRSNCRNTVNGKALPSKIFLIHREDNKLKDLLSKVMPKVQWLPWKPETLTPIKNRSKEIAAAVIEYLRSVPKFIDQVGTRTIGQHLLKLQMKVTKKTFGSAIEIVSNELREWHKRERSFVRGGKIFETN